MIGPCPPEAAPTPGAQANDLQGEGAQGSRGCRSRVSSSVLGPWHFVLGRGARRQASATRPAPLPSWTFCLALSFRSALSPLCPHPLSILRSTIEVLVACLLSLQLFQGASFPVEKKKIVIKIDELIDRNEHYGQEIPSTLKSRKINSQISPSAQLGRETSDICFDRNWQSAHQFKTIYSSPPPHAPLRNSGACC